MKTNEAFVAAFVGQILEKHRLVSVSYYATMPPTVLLCFIDEPDVLYRLTVETLSE